MLDALDGVARLAVGTLCVSGHPYNQEVGADLWDKNHPSSENQNRHHKNDD
jgi:hypothetical protein